MSSLKEDLAYCAKSINSFNEMQKEQFFNSEGGKLFLQKAVDFCKALTKDLDSEIDNVHEKMSADPNYLSTPAPSSISTSKSSIFKNMGKDDFMTMVYGVGRLPQDARKAFFKSEFGAEVLKGIRDTEHFKDYLKQLGPDRIAILEATDSWMKSADMVGPEGL